MKLAFTSLWLYVEADVQDQDQRVDKSMSARWVRLRSRSIVSKMCMCVCVRVCVCVPYVYVCVCECVCVYVFVCVCVSWSEYISLCVYVYVYVRIYMSFRFSIICHNRILKNQQDQSINMHVHVPFLETVYKLANSAEIVWHLMYVYIIIFIIPNLFNLPKIFVERIFNNLLLIQSWVAYSKSTYSCLEVF